MDDFLKILEEYEITFKQHGEHHHTTKGFVNLDCPFCSRNTSKYRLGYSLSYHYCSCWVCGYHHPTKVLHALTGTYFTLQKAKKYKFKSKSSGVVGKYTIPNQVGDLLKGHKDYLVNRGFNCKSLVRLWQIQGIGISPRLSWRIFIPIFYQGEPVSWTTRTIGNNKLRYISASKQEEKIPHKHLLYGQDYARNAIIIVEGPFDAWAIGPGAVATFGLTWTNEQISKMIQYPLRIICFDAEPKAQMKARELGEMLSGFPGDTRLLKLKTGKDAATASKEEIKEIRKLYLEDDITDIK